jgi:hypothetical protein
MHAAGAGLSVSEIASVPSLPSDWAVTVLVMTTWVFCGTATCSAEFFVSGGSLQKQYAKAILFFLIHKRQLRIQVIASNGYCALK